MKQYYNRNPPRQNTPLQQRLLDHNFDSLVKYFSLTILLEISKYSSWQQNNLQTLNFHTFVLKKMFLLFLRCNSERLLGTLYFCSSELLTIGKWITQILCKTSRRRSSRQRKLMGEIRLQFLLSDFSILTELLDHVF